MEKGTIIELREGSISAPLLCNKLNDIYLCCFGWLFRS
jgi:hypothetical protein